MSLRVTCDPVTATAIHLRSARLAGRLERGARELADFARALTDAEWRMSTPGDGRPVGVIVHHVATVYPLEVRLAQMIASGTRIVGVTWATVHEMNAAHALEHGDVSKPAALSLLAENSAAAADAIRLLSDDELDCAVPVSLYGDAELTCQFMLEDHAVRHSYHHLARLRAAMPQAAHS
ncbi:MAG TPA: DinB family protein [Vicinamibacterales bacterium]|nr:DinB family protein [Vicinamibacterales bacterium]